MSLEDATLDEGLLMVSIRCDGAKFNIADIEGPLASLHRARGIRRNAKRKATWKIALHVHNDHVATLNVHRLNGVAKRKIVRRCALRLCGSCLQVHAECHEQHDSSVSRNHHEYLSVSKWPRQTEPRHTAAAAL